MSDFRALNSRSTKADVQEIQFEHRSTITQPTVCFLRWMVAPDPHRLPQVTLNLTSASLPSRLKAICENDMSE